MQVTFGSREEVVFQNVYILHYLFRASTPSIPPYKPKKANNPPIFSYYIIIAYMREVIAFAPPRRSYSIYIYIYIYIYENNIIARKNNIIFFVYE